MKVQRDKGISKNRETLNMNENRKKTRFMHSFPQPVHTLSTII